MSVHQLPRVFIGSSSEALDVAYALQVTLEFDAEPTAWTQGIFQPSSFALKDLVAALADFDFAVFVFNPDDMVTMRSKHFQAVRDNVIFELGLFMGRLGIDRCFVLKPRGQSQLHLPTDLLGLQALDFAADRSDRNLLAALGPAAHQLRGVFAKIGRAPTQSATGTSYSIEDKQRNLNRYLKIWNSDVLQGDRQRANDGLAMNMIEDEDGQDMATVNRVIAFLETVCDAAIRGELDSSALDHHLGSAIRRFHEFSSHFFRSAAHDGEPWQSAVISEWLHGRING